MQDQGFFDKFLNVLSPKRSSLHQSIQVNIIINIKNLKQILPETKCFQNPYIDWQNTQYLYPINQRTSKCNNL